MLIHMLYTMQQVEGCPGFVAAAPHAVVWRVAALSLCVPLLCIISCWPVPDTQHTGRTSRAREPSPGGLVSCTCLLEALCCNGVVRCGCADCVHVRTHTHTKTLARKSTAFARLWAGVELLDWCRPVSVADPGVVLHSVQIHPCLVCRAQGALWAGCPACLLGRSWSYLGFAVLLPLGQALLACIFWSV